MAKTFVLAFKKSDDADTAVGQYQKAGYKVVRVNGSDRVELKVEAEQSIHWKSGSESDWTLVIATKDPLVGPA